MSARKPGRTHAPVTLPPFDLLRRGGHLVDPSTGWNRPAAIGTRDGRVAVARHAVGHGRHAGDAEAGSAADISVRAGKRFGTTAPELPQAVAAWT